MKLRVILIDDEELARERLRRLLGDKVEIVAECADGPSAVDAILTHQPDLLFLDIQMPGMDGFEVLAALDEGQMPGVIFVTGFDEHAVRAFEARALDYLLKPTDAERVEKALAHAMKRLSAPPSVPAAVLDFLSERAEASGRLRRVPVRHGDRTLFVPVEEIFWIEAAGNYAVLHTADKSHVCRETMSAFERQLPENFLRVSRSAILNLSEVVEIQAQPTGEHLALLSSGATVALTRSVKEIETRLRRV